MNARSRSTLNVLRVVGWADRERMGSAVHSAGSRRLLNAGEPLPRIFLRPVLDDASGAGRVAYCVDNPRKANLVDDAEHWPGLHLCYGLGDADEIDFEYFDTTACNRAGRPDDIEDFFETATLTLSPLPSSKGRERDDYAKDVRRWVAQRLREELSETQDVASKERKPALGVDKVIDSAFDQRPKSANMGRRPYCFGSPGLVREHYEQTSTTLAVYADRSEAYRGGRRDVKFPPGTYRPPVLAAA